MNENGSKYKKIIIPIIVSLIVVALMSLFVMQIFGCSQYFNREALTIAEKYTVDNATAVRTSAGKSFTGVKTIASDVSKLSDYDAIDSFGDATIEKYDIQCLQFYKGNEAKFRYGVAVGSSTSVYVTKLIEKGKFGCSELFTDKALGTNIQCVAVYAPVSGNKDIDSVVAYFVMSKAIPIRYSHEDILSMHCVASNSGIILDKYVAKGFKNNSSNNIFDYLNRVTQSKSEVRNMQKYTALKVTDSYMLLIDGEKYAISCVQFDNFGINCVVINMYKITDILNKEYTNYNKLFVATFGMIVLVVGSLLAYVVTKHKSDTRLNFLDAYDPVLGCNSYNKFMRDATEILTANRNSSYAVLYFDLNKFSYVKEHFDPETSEGTLRYVSNVVKKMTSANETYGHVIDDCFVSLIHFSNPQELSDRIKILDALISNYDVTKSKGFTLKLSIGVYDIDREENFEIQEMIDRATIAQKVHKKMPDKPFVVYDSSIRTSYLKEAEIESKMDYALTNHEFRVFFQPKYNIKNDAIDGAEALVRWYDASANTYIGPDLFVPLFEVNGFISKLDRYIYGEVLKYMKEANNRGEKVVPISVNVSRVTATQSDFLPYYIQKKREAGIPDGFIMLEFTESFAYENYETIAEIVTNLKKNGFKCSIDDFGSGYSSFNILKELQMDELKLDKFFLKATANPEKDEMLLKTMVSLGKSFGMKVTQEGVESMEELVRLRDYGCDVIQGFYYSVPLPMSDYIDFVVKDTSLSGIKHLHANAYNTKPSAVTTEEKEPATV